MNSRLVATALAVFALTVPCVLPATTVKQMNLEDLAHSADRIFRGTVVSVQTGSVPAGGAELSTVTYTLKVDESFKGDYVIDKGDVRLVKITMITDPKTDASAGIRKMALFRDVPRLALNGDYLLFTSAESAIGLSTTIGLGQGCFDIHGGMALNRAGNLGLFRGTAYAGPSGGALAYGELSDRIREILAVQ